MKCPNCGQEAMNVNGKFICLDCGIQLGGTEAAPTAPAGPQIVNHTSNIASADQDESIEENVPSSTPVPIDPIVAPESVEKPVQNIYEQALKEETSPAEGSFDFPSVEGATADSETDSVAQPSKPKAVVPDFPSSFQTENAPVAEAKEEAPVFPPVTPAVPPLGPVPDFPTFESTEPLAPEQVSNPEITAESEVVMPQVTLPAATEAMPESPEVVAEPFEPSANEATNPAITLPDLNLNDFQPVSEPVSEPAPLSLEQESQSNLDVPNLIDPQMNNVLPQNPTEENMVGAGAIPSESPSLEGSPEVGAKEMPNPEPTPVQETVDDFGATTIDPVPATTEVTGSNEATPNSFFQPETMAINPVSQSEVAQNFSSPAFSTPANITADQPEIGSPDGQNTVAVEKEVKAEEAVQEVAPKSLDELLNNSPVPEVATAPDFANFNPPRFDSLQSVDPLAIKSANTQEGIPSVESVFGSSAAPQTTSVPASQGKSKKVLYMVIGVVAGILIIVGMVFGFMAYRKSAARKKQLLLEQELLKISDKVANAMDASMDVAVNYEETIDFTKVTFVESDNKDKVEQFKKLSQKPVENKGFWKNDDKGNATIESNLEKKVYKADKNKTLVYSDRWTEKDGYDITSAPALYNPQSKGGPFYLTQVERFVNMGGESVDGETLTKVKIIPKKDMMKEVIRSANPALASASYESINTSNIEIIAWIDGKSLIRKITFMGDLGITSDLFNGTVSINSKAEYKYAEVMIETPTAFGKEIILPKVQTLTGEALPRKFEIVDMRG